VQNLAGEHNDVWAVNADDEYHEEANLPTALPEEELRALQKTQPGVPRGL
jgi:hypothetical protein